MKKMRFSILILFALVISACAPVVSRADGVEFRSIDEIVEQPLQVTNFANDGTATLPIKTTIPVACSIVYGKTPNLVR